MFDRRVNSYAEAVAGMEVAATAMIGGFDAPPDLQR